MPQPPLFIDHYGARVQHGDRIIIEDFSNPFFIDNEATVLWVEERSMYAWTLNPDSPINKRFSFGNVGKFRKI